MSSGLQNFGFDPTNPIIIGKDASINFPTADLQAANVASAEWALFALRPEESTSQSALVTKTVAGGGITLTNNGTSVDFTVTLNPADTSALAGGDYFHRLDYVHTDGRELEAARGNGRLTPRV